MTKSPPSGKPKTKRPPTRIQVLRKEAREELKKAKRRVIAAQRELKSLGVKRKADKK
jgi:hypothetical protein